jgi:hypothetical protein
VATQRWNEDDRTNYSHALARRLPAEVLYDSVYRTLGSASKIPGVAPGTRAAELVDSEVELPSGFFTTFGRPVRESACECERTAGLQLGPVMALVSGPTVADAIADPENALTRLAATEADDGRLVNELFLRILNRPATESEIAACLEPFSAVEADHQRLAEQLAKAELEFALRRPELERQREAALAAARQALAAHEAELAPRRAEAEKAREALIAQREKELADYEATLPARLAEWEKSQSPVERWAVLAPSKLEPHDGSTLAAQPDGTIVASGENRNSEVWITAETDLTDITGLRLEALPADGLPNRGPGRAPDGNFVVTQFEAFAAPKANPADARPIKLVNPLADFSQANFPIANLLNGDRTNQGTGWAVSPRTGVHHWATFEAEAPVGTPGGTVLTFKITQYFAGGVYHLGRFRISATRAPKPVGLSLPEDFRATLATAPEIRTEAQKAALMAHFRTSDDGWREKADALNAARAPLPPDARLAELQKAVEAAGQPVPVDPRLVQLRADLDQSVRQAVGRRLTAAQDIAWALLNSPAFLFNH